MADDFYGRDWVEHRHALFDGIRALIGRLLNSRSRLQEGGNRKRAR